MQEKCILPTLTTYWSVAAVHQISHLEIMHTCVWSYTLSVSVRCGCCWTLLHYSDGVSVSSTKTKRKRGDSGRVEDEEDGEEKKKETTRPNYFISVPITNPEVRAYCSVSVPYNN